MSNPFAALVKNDLASSKSNEKSSELATTLEHIFAFTLNEQSSIKNGYLYLGDEQKCFQDSELDLNILEYCLSERLFNCYKDNMLIGETKERCPSHSHSSEDRVVYYLYMCYRLTNELTNLSRKEIDTIKGLIIRNMATGFTNPGIYYEQILEGQLIEIVKDMLPYYEDFFIESIKAIQKQEEEGEIGVIGLRGVVSRMVLQMASEVIKTPLSMFDCRLFHMLQLFLIDEPTAQLFMECVQSPNPTVGTSFTTTLLGSLINLSVLPKAPSMPFEHFHEPLSQASVESTEGLLWIKANNVAENMHTLMLGLLKSGARCKELMLRWLGQCLEANADREKLWTSQAPIEFNPANYTNASDSFMIQFCNVMLRLCQPFCNLNKILKVDPTYCAVSEDDLEMKGMHLSGMSTETSLLPVAHDNDLIETRLTAKNYSFITECFYFTHRAIHLGYAVCVEKLVRLSHEMGRLERAFNETTQQTLNQTDLLDSLKERMAGEMSKFLSYKCQLSEPVLVNLMFDLMSSTAYWLCQVAVHTELGEKDSYSPLSEISINFPLTGGPPDTLKCIPEFIVDNIVSFMVYLMRFNPKIYEEQGYEKLRPLLTFILMFMGNNNLVKNPHLRAQLAEGLQALLPYHKEEEAGPLKHQLGSYQRTRLFDEYEHKQQIVISLLEVFVGIEMTGQSVEFEQKFNYRRPMYAIMKYLWKTSDYMSYFQNLAVEAEEHMEAVSPPIFLRFVNLLMNDAVFLLDEALSNMSKLREMQQARENGEWDTLPARERSQNVGYLHHVGMLARFDNILGKDTIKAIEKLTRQIKIVFTHATMVDRMAAMLNYFLLNLVGPNKKNFKVRDSSEFNFDPAKTVLTISKIYINLKDSTTFCLAISQDGRSYSPHLFKLTEDVLVRIGGSALIQEIRDVAEKVAVKALEIQASEEAIAEAPDHYLDPIMSTLMADPVTLPSSRQVVDRTTIARHLLSDQTDPFNRAPLSMDQVIPNTELAQEIQAWVAERKKQ